MTKGDWHEVVALEPKGQAEIYGSLADVSGELAVPKTHLGVVQNLRVTADDIVEITLDGNRKFIFPNRFAPFEIESFNGEMRVRFETAYHTEVKGRPELGFAPNYLYLH